MPPHSPLTPAEFETLLALPTEKDELIRHYTFAEADLAVIRQHRGDHNRLGFAIQLCYLRYPGCALPPNVEPPEALLPIVAQQLEIDPLMWSKYAKRAETRREHLLELQTWLGLTSFTQQHARQLVHHLTDLAQQTDRGIVLAMAFLDRIRQKHIIVPTVDVIERVCAEALSLGTKKVYKALTDPLSKQQRGQLDKLLSLRKGNIASTLLWLRQPPGMPNAKHVLEHISRLEAIRAINLQNGLERVVHQNRLMKLAREGGQMTAQHLSDLEPTRGTQHLLLWC